MLVQLISPDFYQTLIIYLTESELFAGQKVIRILLGQDIRMSNQSKVKLSVVRVRVTCVQANGMRVKLLDTGQDGFTRRREVSMELLLATLQPGRLLNAHPSARSKQPHINPAAPLRYAFQPAWVEGEMLTLEQALGLARAVTGSFWGSD
jgi:hypothetical protein